MEEKWYRQMSYCGILKQSVPEGAEGLAHVTYCGIFSIKLEYIMYSILWWGCSRA
jgi:hypothetical protein